MVPGCLLVLVDSVAGLGGNTGASSKLKVFCNSLSGRRLEVYVSSVVDISKVEPSIAECLVYIVFDRVFSLRLG